MDRHDFKTVEEALAHMVECALDTLDLLRDRASTPKIELSRYHRITQSGVFAARIFHLEEAVQKVGAVRLDNRLREGGENSTPDRVFNTAAETLCWMVECEMATLGGLKIVKRTPKRTLQRHEMIVSDGLAACAKFGLTEAAHRARCSRVEDALKHAT